MFMLVLWNQIVEQFHNTGKNITRPSETVIVQNYMRIYQISYKKPETILVKLNTSKKNCQAQIGRTQKKVYRSTD